MQVMTDKSIGEMSEEYESSLSELWWDVDGFKSDLCRRQSKNDNRRQDTRTAVEKLKGMKWRGASLYTSRISDSNESPIDDIIMDIASKYKITPHDIYSSGRNGKPVESRNKSEFIKFVSYIARWDFMAKKRVKMEACNSTKTKTWPNQ